MSLVSDAGSRSSSAFWATSDCPLSTSTSRYDFAAIAGGGTAAGVTVWAAAVAATIANRYASDANGDQDMRRRWRRRVALYRRATARVPPLAGPCDRRQIAAREATTRGKSAMCR